VVRITDVLTRREGCAWRVSRGLKFFHVRRRLNAGLLVIALFRPSQWRFHCDSLVPCVVGRSCGPCGLLKCRLFDRARHVRTAVPPVVGSWPDAHLYIAIFLIFTGFLRMALMVSLGAGDRPRLVVRPGGF